MSQKSTIATLRDEYLRRAEEVRQAVERSEAMEREFLETKVLNRDANAACGHSHHKRREFAAWLMQNHDALFALSASESTNAAPQVPVSASLGAQGEGAVSRPRNGEPLSPPTAVASPAAAAPSTSTATSAPAAAPPEIDREWWKAQGVDACIDRMVLIAGRAEKAERDLAYAVSRSLYEIEADRAMTRALALSETPSASGETTLPADILALCKARGWNLHWTHRGAYLHLEASELIEALRGKRGEPLHEAADVLLVLMSITENAGLPWGQVMQQARAICEDLKTRPRYAGEEFEVHAAQSGAPSATLPLALLKRLNRKIDWFDNKPAYADTADLLRALRAHLLGNPTDSVAPSASECTWTPDEDGIYHTGCGNAFTFDSGTAEENRAKFCQYCGGSLVSLGSNAP